MILFIFVFALGVFIYMKHIQQRREAGRRERLEEKQEQVMEMLRRKNKPNDAEE